MSLFTQLYPSLMCSDLRPLAFNFIYELKYSADEFKDLYMRIRREALTQTINNKENENQMLSTVLQYT